MFCSLARIMFNYNLYYIVGIRSFRETEAEFCPMCQDSNVIKYNISCHTYTCEVPQETQFAQLKIDNIVLPPQRGDQLNKVYVLCARSQQTGTITVHIPDFCENNHTTVSCVCTTNTDLDECCSNSTEPLGIAG